MSVYFAENRLIGQFDVRWGMCQFNYMFYVLQELQGISDLSGIRLQLEDEYSDVSAISDIESSVLLC
mgnify:FL=1